MMKKVLGLILTLILILGSAKADAKTLNTPEIKSKISQQVMSDYQKYTDAQLVVNVIALPFANLVVPEGKVTFATTSQVDRFMARDLKKVVISVDGKPVRTFNVPVEVKAYKNVLVASTFIERDRAISASVVTSKTMEISNNLEYTITSDMLGKEIMTKKVFREGEIIDKRFVKFRPDVQKNAVVTVYFNSNDLSVSIDAVALSDGMMGDYIGLENKAYKKMYTGKVIGENKVLVEI